MAPVVRSLNVLARTISRTRAEKLPSLAEGLVTFERWKSIPSSLRRSAALLVLGACLVAQLLLGPARDIAMTIANWADVNQR